MYGPPTTPSPAGFLAIIVGLAFVLLLVGAFATEGVASEIPVASPVATSNNWALGGGLLGLGTAQNVTRTPFWESYCATPTNYCANPFGLAIVQPPKK